MTTVNFEVNTGGHIFVIGAGRKVLWERDLTMIYDTLGPNKPSRDKLGHIFLNFNPGRYNGVIILRPTTAGFNDFNTLPPLGEYDTRFYSGEAVDTDGDGVLEVLVTTNDCHPDCAGGTREQTKYRWDGRDYAPGECTRVYPEGGACGNGT